MRTAAHRPIVLALTAVTALSLTACAKGRDYAVPQQACGVTLNEKTLDPFLIDGEKMEIVGDSLIETGEDTRGHCEIRVDGKRLVYLRVAKVDKLYDPSGEEEAFRFTDRETMKDLPFAGVGALGDAAAMVSTACASTKARFLSVLVTVDGEAAGEVTERRKNLRAFTVDLVPEVKKALGCTA
ncbi:hypothetical protein [Streptomyces roseolus]|uniref:hypothetical protein n=1 Tax=Streptomyces roseolus TaxID=67358 RepID=UPI00167C08AD|nr:hypothetical protein [Streptomyces roseolus]GGR20444.1 hypothetical protein GCM10010282_11050 [Streptomyces roseolus]